MKPETTLKDLLKPPFLPVALSMVWDSNARLLDIRGEEFFYYQENGERLRDEFRDFVVAALNEKWERDYGGMNERPY